jgi:D-aminoacyl-tRNA deacylase
MEVTHHGPLINKPCVFLEIGGGEDEWRDKRAAFCIAKALSEAIETFKENPYTEIAVGIGGPHYCPGFNKLQLDSNVAFAHIIPKYVSPITEEMIKEAIAKTVEEVDFVVLDWKGLGNSEERQKVLDILANNYIQYKKIQEIKK